MSEEVWQQLVGLDALRNWMDGQALGRGPLEPFTPPLSPLRALRFGL